MYSLSHVLSVVVVVVTQLLGDLSLSSVSFRSYLSVTWVIGCKFYRQYYARTWVGRQITVQFIISGIRSEEGTQVCR